MSVETFIPGESNARLGTVDIEVFGWNSLFPDSRQAASACQRSCSADREGLHAPSCSPHPVTPLESFPCCHSVPSFYRSVFRVSDGVQI